MTERDQDQFKDKLSTKLDESKQSEAQVDESKQADESNGRLSRFGESDSKDRKSQGDKQNSNGVESQAEGAHPADSKTGQKSDVTADPLNSPQRADEDDDHDDLPSAIISTSSPEKEQLSRMATSRQDLTSDTVQDVQSTAKTETQEVEEEPRRWHWSIRLLVRIFMILLFPAACLLAIYVGLYVGYVRLGDQPAEDILQWETWRHIYDLVFGE